MTNAVSQIPDWARQFSGNQKALLKRALRATALVKLGEFQRKREVFKNKYKTNFAGFKKKVEKSKKENPSFWDDLIVWEGIEKTLQKWQARYRQLL
jgi:hypothetical protein